MPGHPRPPSSDNFKACKLVRLSPPFGPWDCVWSGLHPRTNPAFSQFYFCDPDNLPKTERGLCLPHPHSPLSELSQCKSALGGGGGCRTQRRPIQKPSKPKFAPSLLYRLLLGFGESHKSQCIANLHTLNGSACETRRPSCEYMRSRCVTHAGRKVPTHIFLKSCVLSLD